MTKIERSSIRHSSLTKDNKKNDKTDLHNKLKDCENS